MDRIKKCILLLIAIILPISVLVLYYLHYKGSSGFEGTQCSIHWLTGLNCPGCGGQRAVYALMHGNFMDAMRSNALLVLGVPFLIYVYYYFIQVYIFKNETYRQKSLLSGTGVAIFVGMLIVFTILRNIPIEPFIYLSPRV